MGAGGLGSNSPCARDGQTKEATGGAASGSWGGGGLASIGRSRRCWAGCDFEGQWLIVQHAFPSAAWLSPTPLNGQSQSRPNG